MAFRLEDFKKTTRKAAGGAPPSLFPHQMRDRKALSRLEVTIRTFDSLVGKKRGEMDAGALADFFGDPRLARGVVACLGRWYRYQTPRLAQVVGAEAEQRLRDAGLGSPMALRAQTYAHVNAGHGGFLAEAERAGCYAGLGEPFGLTAHAWDALLHLDAEDNQVLVRPGSVPSAADAAALYNFHALDTPLRRATRVVLNNLALAAGDGADVRALARALGLRAVVSGDGQTVTLTDQEMSGLLPRRPGRLARCVLLLLHTWATSAAAGYADVLLGTRRFRLALGADANKALGVRRPVEDRSWTFRRRTEAADALGRDLARLRAGGTAAGWRILRQPDPLVTAGGVLLPDFRLQRGDRAVFVVLGGPAGGEWDAPVLGVPLGRKPVDAAALLARAEEAVCDLFAAPDRPMPDVPGEVLRLCDRAAAQGMVRAADAQRALHLLDESPLIEWVRRAGDPRVRYIPGIGLCSQDLVTAITRDEQTAPA